MKPLLLFLIAALFAGNLGAATSATGLWVGTYEYPDNAQPPVSFSAVFKSGKEAESSMATGNSIEVNTFGAPLAPALGGNMIIRIFDDNRVEMVKTYDGKGDISHSVWYSGKYDPAADSIAGTWYIADGWSASFTMKRIAGR